MIFDYITADTHFGHANMNIRPSRMIIAQIDGYDTFDEYLIDIWNETVNENDNILHLGDFAFRKGYQNAKEFLGDFAFRKGYQNAKELKGNITLLIGNHDKKEHIDFYKKLGWKIIDKITFDIPKSHLIQNNLKKEFTKDELDNNLLACLVCDINDKRVMFSHFPVYDDNPYDFKYSEITKILEYIFKETKCDLNIHGHTHSIKAKEEFCKSACLELNNFKLIKTDQGLI